jgi:hypothetical protein
MYEKLDMNYGRVLYESGKRECERNREKMLKIYFSLFLSNNSFSKPFI